MTLESNSQERNPFFTIVIPTYNRADILPFAISTVINQVFKNWELIVVDDGSRDNTKEVVEGVADPRVYYRYQKNAERSAARNNGVAHAMGRYVCFLDSDDFYDITYLQEMYNFIVKRNYPKELIIGSLVNWYSEKRQEENRMPDINGPVAKWLFANPMTPTRVCVEKSIFNDYGFRDDVIIVEDTVLWVSLSNKYKVSLNRKAKAFYRCHEGNSVSFENNAYGMRLKGLSIFFKDKESMVLSQEDKDRILSDCYFGIFKHHAWHKRWFKARKTMAEAIIKYPNIRLKEKIYLLLFPMKWQVN
jgi:glycosyltransferase involved in cell wall biosynthesis